MALVVTTLCGGVPSAASASDATIRTTIRDFRSTHPDFGSNATVTGPEAGVVGARLGADDKPVYVGGRSTSTAANFSDWYNTTAGVNDEISFDMLLTEDPSTAVLEFDDTSFFPINDQGFGNEGALTNKDFTLEFEAEFEYQSGEEFTVAAMTDYWFFVNGHLAIDGGGLSTVIAGSTLLDVSNASTFGLTVGSTYSISLFYAHRLSSNSSFRFTAGGVQFVGCGTGTIDPGEACDDGNLVSGDGCSESCTLEASGVPMGGFPSLAVLTCLLVAASVGFWLRRTRLGST